MNIKYILVFIICTFNIIVASRRYSGTYRYVNKNTGRTHYVGATNNFNRRHFEHVKNNKYYTKNNYVMIKNYMPYSSSDEIYHVEKQQIKKYKPVANKHKGGNGPRWN